MISFYMPFLFKLDRYNLCIFSNNVFEFKRKHLSKIVTCADLITAKICNRNTGICWLLLFNIRMLIKMTEKYTHQSNKQFAIVFTYNITVVTVIDYN